MMPEIEDELRSEFPIALRDVAVIECGDGWHELVRDCADAAERATIALVGIKEKFGELRVDLQGGEIPKSVVDAVESAELRSRTTCEVCGAPGGLQVVNGWALTRCNVHDPSLRESRIAEVAEFLRGKKALAEQGVTVDRFEFDVTADEFEEAVRRAKASKP